MSVKAKWGDEKKTFLLLLREWRYNKSEEEEEEEKKKKGEKNEEEEKEDEEEEEKKKKKKKRQLHRHSTQNGELRSQQERPPRRQSTVGGGASKLKRTSQHLSSEDEDESRSDPPAPRKASKIGFGMSSQTGKKANPISIKLGASKPKEPVPSAPPKKLGLASVFNEDDDSEPEEMPPEAKMRMKNIGRETPTSAGPNSFNKGKQGFSDNQKLWERKLKAQSDK
ncbi:PEST proteolytic signal-containing nuclear protein-like isoform X1 [Phyllopteryx taeniolatus]|uniref:PEST proteolytic signal-containing nuclear protein-like isoform X1 n=1 Tax=Phyllopteryx taeniolatus TaxID=161469 RepID=UPI002AD43887|nr:PEST proteolytic signal-containing nuclear protein-like isoform X1 [Phyllopteryx taeniolatus]